MDITYNGIFSPSSSILTFTEVPNILSISEDISGTKGVFTFSFYGNLKSTVISNGQYHITFLDETVTNVTSAQNAMNKRFFISQDTTATAASLARALRNCSSIAAQFNVIHSTNQVTLEAKTIGQIWVNYPNYFETNIPSQYMSANGTDGTAYSDLFGAKIQIDVYTGNSTNQYVTTLEKNFYGDECAFDMSPVLATIGEYGTTQKYKFHLGIISDSGSYYSPDNIFGNVTPGYQANQSDRYMYMSTPTILLNTNRNQIRYVYGQTIPFTIIGSGSTTISYTVKDSAMDTLTTATESVSATFTDHEYTIPQSVYNDVSYVDITSNNKTWRFKVIKPLKATEYYQRILWRNEYGGIEFFDFTGKRSETDSVDIETYEKNIFDFYTNPSYELKKIYKNDAKKQVKVASHLLDADGRWFANSLMRSKKVWTRINNKTHYIIPKNIDVQEDGTYNNIYTVELTYEYSQLS